MPVAIENGNMILRRGSVKSQSTQKRKQNSSLILCIIPVRIFEELYPSLANAFSSPDMISQTIKARMIINFTV